MSCLPWGSDNNSAAHCPLKASQSIPSKLIDPVTTDTPFRRNGFDVVLGYDMRQCIELAIDVGMTSGQISPPKAAHL